MRYNACTSPDCPCQTGPVMSTPVPKPIPSDVEAWFDRVVELVWAWDKANDWADNCPASERDDARGAADEAKDEVLQYLGRLYGGAA